MVVTARMLRVAGLGSGIAVAIAVTGFVVTSTRSNADSGGVDPATRAALGVFREARTASDALPGDPEAALRGTGDLRTGEEPGLSRRIGYSAGDAFLWPMEGGVCHSSPAGSGCVPTRVIEDDGVSIGVRSRLNLATRTYDDVRAFGIVRDGIDAVTLRLGDGTEVSATVRRNTFLSLGLSDQPVAVTLNDESGPEVVEVPGRPAEALAREIAGP